MGVGFNVLLGAIEAVFVADGVIGFLFAWEVMSLVTAALVATEHERLKYRAQIEPTFERFLYGPLTRGVMGAAARMKVIQAGSLHAYLAYVLVLGIVLLLWLGGGR